MVAVLLDALVPVFAGLLLGYVAGARKVVDNQNVKNLVTFLMSFALPCSLFVVIARTPRPLLVGQAKVAVVLALVYLVTFLVTGFVSRRVGRYGTADMAVLALTLGFPNSAAVGIPLLQAVYGAQASVTVAVAIAVGSITVTPITLAILESGTGEGRALSHAARIRTSLRKALVRPVFWAPVLGVAVAVATLHLPTYVETSLKILGAATEGTALFVTGLIASSQRFTFNRGVAWAVLGKNVLQPALCLALALLFRLPVEPTRYVVLLCALPSGFFGILFGKGFGATPEVASSSLIASTVLGIFTLAGWIVLLPHVS